MSEKDKMQATELAKIMVDASHYSQHLYGRAADIWIAGVSVDTLAAYIETLLPNRGGIGWYYNDKFVHVDVRTAKSRWKG